MNNFGFKWLHFYVTTALQLLAQSEMGKVTKVYGRTKEVTQLIGVNRLKFGHFLYTTKNENHTALRGEKSVLTLFTYHGVNIEDFSANPCEEEVLVPGFEVFTLSPGKMELNSTRKYCSDFNCAYISGEVPKKPNPDCI
ncbi:ecto-ADP-ribosyltransferase 3-like [Leptodactylus fuscus]